MLTLIGVTYLFAIAQNNGTVDLLVRGAVKLVAGRVALIPWIMFAVTGVLTAIGALGPAAVAIIAPIALGFAAKYRISPLLMGMMVIHGAQAGGFSPISVYGVTVNNIVAANDLPSSPVTVFLGSLFFNLAIGIVLFLVLGGRGLAGRRVGDEPEVEPADGDTDAPVSGHGTSAGSGVDVEERTGVSAEQVLTLVGLVVLVLLAWSSTSTSGSSPSPSPPCWRCSPPPGTRARSCRSAGPPCCSSPAC